MKRSIAILSLFLVQLTYAQGPGCANVDAGPTQVNLDCTETCTDLTATFLETGDTNSYEVSSIPFNPPENFVGLANSLFVNGDDIWSGVVDLPFNFCFFGGVYDQLIVGANGGISFDVSNAGTTNGWSFDDPLPYSGTNITLADVNIFGAVHDIDPAASNGTHDIAWEIKGTAPCRTFVISYFNVAHFSSSCNDLKTSQQIVLYEGTNAIDVYILDKPTCFSWNNGNAVIGIQNPAGTIAYTPPGRNTGSWSASIEAWRFTPNGAPNYELSWYDGSGNFISHDTTINVCPSADETYTAEVEYTNCDNTVFTDSDTVTVTLSTAGDASFYMTPTCDGATATITGDTGGVFSFNPVPTDGATIDPATGEVTNGVTGETYTVEYTTSGACAATTTESFTVLSTGDASFTMTPTCDGGTATITGDTGGSFSFNPVPTDGAVIDTATGTVTGGVTGATYTIEYATTGACAASSTETVTVAAAEDASFTMTATCDGGTATITGDSGGTFTFNPVPTDGATINAGTGEVTNGTPEAVYTIEYTTAGACPETETQTVTVLAADDASFTMNANCEGGTATITGDAGGTFAFNPVPTDGATIDTVSGEVTGGTSGTTYTIEYTTSGVCPETSTQTVTVLATGDASFNLTATCDGATATILGSTGGSFVFNPVPTDGANIDTATGEVTNGTPGATYTIEYATTGACAANSTESVTVLPAEDASFTMTGTCGGATANITGDAGGSFVFNPAPTDGATINAATGEITNGTSGATYTIEYTTAGPCPETETQTVTVLTTDDASFVTNPNCDGGTATITGDVGGTFAFNPAPTDGATINAATGEVTNGTSGATYTIEYTTSGVCPSTSTQTVTVLTTGDASFNMTATCDGGTATITGTTGGSFVFNPVPSDGALINAATGEVTNGIPGTTYTIEYATTGSCAASSTETVTVLPTEDASFSVFENCEGGTMTILGDTGGVFAFNPVPTDGAVIDTNTGEVSNGASGATYVVEYTTSGPCSVSSTQNVTVLVTDDPSFNMTATCDGGSATITGTTGGTFAIVPAPTDGTTIDVNTGLVTGATSASTYTVEYTTGGTCPATASQVLTVLTTDDSSFTMSPTCDGGTATITGDTGGTFAFNPAVTDGATIDVNTGEVTNAVSGVTYTIEYTTAGVCPSSTIESVTVYPQEDATFTMSATCDGGTATVTGDAGGVFTFNPIPTDGATINATTGEVTNGTSAATYTVEYTTSGPCSVSTTQNITVLTTDNPAFSMTANCDGGTASVSGTTGGTFAFNPSATDGATINATTGEVTNATSGASYTIEYTTSGACPASDTQVLTVLITDDPSFALTPTCDGATAVVTGDAGGTFAFNPAVTDGAIINAATGEITNGVSGATYSIEYTTSGTCPSSSIESVTVYPQEDATFSMNPNCDGGTATITGDTGGVFTFNPAPTDGATINATTGEVTNGTSGATYTVEYTTSGPCAVSSTQNVTVFIADDASFTMNPNCDGATAFVTGTSGGVFTFDVEPGDGSIIDSVTGEVFNAISGATYSVLYTTGGTCMDSQVVSFTVHPIPDVDLVDTFILCFDNDGNLVNGPIIETGLSILDYTFEWTETSNPTVVLGTDSSYEPIVAGTYSVFVTNISTGCSTVLGSPNTLSVVTNSIPPTGLTATVVSETFANNNVIQASVDSVPGADYEFSIDGGPFESNGTNVYTFNNVSAGEHVVTVRDADGCGDDSTTVLVIDYPKFFTPNDDGHNDTWQIVGISNQLDATIYIFDRYGKLLKQLSPSGAGWDGTLNGYPLPSSDYWFSLEFRDPNNLGDLSRKEFRAHFTLKR